MAYTRRWDLCVSSKDKSGKSRATKVGVVFEDEEGRLQVVIDQGVSISSTPSNYINGYIPREREQQKGAPAQQSVGRPQQPAGSGTNGAQENGQEDDDIPF